MNRPWWTTQPGAVEALLQAIEHVANWRDANKPVCDGILKHAAELAAQAATQSDELPPPVRLQTLGETRLRTSQAATQGAGGEGCGQQPVAWGDMVNAGPFFTTDKAEAERYSRQCYTLTPLYAAPTPTGQGALLAAGKACYEALLETRCLCTPERSWTFATSGGWSSAVTCQRCKSIAAYASAFGCVRWVNAQGETTT